MYKRNIKYIHVYHCSKGPVTNMSATLGGEGVWQMLKLADKGGRSGLANDDGTDKNYQ